MKSSRLLKNRKDRSTAGAISPLAEDASSRETAYLLRSPANAKRLIAAIKSLNRGKGRRR
jgi:PHD/YefM family antitoxin component YafN of YafNO toxin-antitoxin module